MVEIDDNLNKGLRDEQQPMKYPDSLPEKERISPSPNALLRDAHVLPPDELLEAATAI